MNTKIKIVLSWGVLMLFSFAVGGCGPGLTCEGGSGYEAIAAALGTAQTWIDGSLFVYVPPGQFIMGKNAPSAMDYNPAHNVTLDAYWIQQDEVTNGQYQQCQAAGACQAPHAYAGKPNWYSQSAYVNYPVVGVDYDQAAAYCNWIQGRLPTEAEWELAARGTDARTYSWGEDVPACDLLNFEECLPTPVPERVHTHPLGDSPLLLSDTSGNVNEWVGDWFAADYYPISPSQNPTGPATGEQRVVRGSSYLSPAGEVPIYLRSALEPDQHNFDLGFRCVLTGETVANPPPAMCAVVAYLPPAVEIGSAPQADTFSVTYASWCEWSIDKQGWVNLKFDSNISEDQYIVTSDAGPLGKSWDGGFPNILSITGPGVPANSTVNLEICPALAPPPIMPESPLCPSGYLYDEDDDLCHYALAPAGPCECDAAHHYVDGYGCMPLVSGSFPFFDCPPGFDVAMNDDASAPFVCLPIGGEAACVDNPDCSANQICPSGVYVPDMDCCQASPDMPPQCNAGYTFDADHNLCSPPDLGTGCITLEVHIPDCEPEEEDDGDGDGQPGCLINRVCQPCPVGAQGTPCTIP